LFEKTQEFGDAVDALRMFDFRVDFAAPDSSTFTERAESPVEVAPFNPLTPVGRDDIEQPPAASTAAALDSISDRLMFRLAYRNFGGHESLFATHSVNVGTGETLAAHQSGVRYYELRRSPGEPFAIAEQATFAPNADNRWMPSGAMDHQGNLAIGYNVASLTTFPSMRFAGRLATDPSGGLFQGERSLIAGTGVQTNTGSRWGLQRAQRRSRRRLYVLVHLRVLHGREPGFELGRLADADRPVPLPRVRGREAGGAARQRDQRAHRRSDRGSHRGHRRRLPPVHGVGG
jgi:hypothetical protein